MCRRDHWNVARCLTILGSHYVFLDCQLNKLDQAYCEIDNKYHSLFTSFASKSYTNDQAAEFAKHGFLRRIKTLTRCIQNIYRIFPPNRENRLSTDELSDLAINLQAFIINVFGCLDNLAWIWVKEKTIRDSAGNPLEKNQIGLGSKFQLVRETFSEDFQAYLESLSDWFSQTENFRHALAHRIPLYVPPYILDEKEVARVTELEQSIDVALLRSDSHEFERLTAELEVIGRVAPLMVHSFSEKSRQVAFHAQIVSDWNTVTAIAEKMLLEFNT